MKSRAAASARRARSASRPPPVDAEVNTAPGNSPSSASRTDAPSGPRSVSTLLNTMRLGRSERPSEESVSRTTAMRSWMFGCPASATCTRRSASFSSSSVARNAATSVGGSLFTNPTVSDRRIAPPRGNVMRRVVGSSVAKG